MAATASTAGLATLRCSGGDGTPDPSGTPGPGFDESPVPDATANAVRPQDGKQGHTLRYTGFVVRDQSYDPHKTQAGPFYGHQALIYSRLLNYRDQAAGTIAPDLCQAMPEQPDSQTLIFKLNPNARWHEVAPLNGRAVTAEDVKYSAIRQLSGDTSFVRKAQWAVVDTIEASDAGTVTFKLKSPMAAMHHLFADVHSFVVAPEITGDANDIGSGAQVGSGPFQWVEWVDGKHASVRRNPNWHGGDRRPHLDGISLVQAATTTDVEAQLRTREIDAAMVGRVLADKLKAARNELVETTMGHSQFFGMRFGIDHDPYNDLRFRSALSIALDRRAMVQKFFGGSGDVNPWVSWPITDWALPNSELTTRPGYRPGEGGRQEDIREARALLDAFRGAKTLKDDLPLFVLDETEAALEFGETIRQQLEANLGLTQVRVVPVPLAELSNLLVSGTAPFAAGPDSGWIDLDDWVYPYFHANGTKNSFPLRDTDLTTMIDAQRVELNKDARREIGYNIQRRLLDINAGVNLVSERVVALSWPYVKGFPLDTTDGYQHKFADCWIDQSDATFRAR